ncbi:MAG: pyridoxal 5'-phosphate synthase glutaminase subunit PdxT [Spirochaetales bacterium]|nr:pyridoxal 5'-phosphate synthase glutaminase subunit PdxT [Spirochaetales bacterium]
MAKKVGVLALQGDFERHLAALDECGAEGRVVRLPAELDGLDGFVIPGGESTTIGKLLVRFGLFGPLAALLKDGFPVYGSCAGLIVLAAEIAGYDQPGFRVFDLAVDRNAYGPQVESFEADLDAPALGPEPLRAVFIRAPVVTRAGSGVEVLARFEDRPVLVRQSRLLGSTFHPELTPDRRVHNYFLSIL